MLHFQHIEYLYLLILVPVIIFFFFRLLAWKKKTRKKIGDPELVDLLTSEYSPKKFGVKFILAATALALCIVAVAGLVLPDPSQRITKSGTDMIIALDVSNSMMATDIKPNRLERAKQLISRVIDQMPDERIGLVVFAGRAYLQMPLTIDHQAAKMFVTSLTTGDIPTQGTVISDALRMSLAVFNPKNKSYKSVLLISDGEDHDPDAITAAKELAKEGVMVNTVGIGTPTGATLEDGEKGQIKIDKEGNTVVSRLNEQELKDIAQQTHGIYQYFSNPNDIVNNLKNQLAGIEKSEINNDDSYLVLKQYYIYFLLAALVLLIIEMIISERTRKMTVAVLILLPFLSASVKAQSVNQLIREGNRFFAEQKYDEAEEKYQAILNQTDENDVADFNMANLQFRKNNVDKAIHFYDLAIKNAKTDEVRQKAYYNRGVAYQKADKKQESILSYKNALILNPGDEEARQNLQRLLADQRQNPEKTSKNSPSDKPKSGDEKQNDNTRPKPPSINKKDADEKLKALENKEQELQNKIHQVKEPSSNPLDKDW